MFLLYRMVRHGEHPILEHVADLETDKAVIEELARLDLHANDVRLFTKEAQVKEEKNVWIETNGNK